jgi:hypothetical protein
MLARSGQLPGRGAASLVPELATLPLDAVLDGGLLPVGTDGWPHVPLVCATSIGAMRRVVPAVTARREAARDRLLYVHAVLATRVSSTASEAGLGGRRLGRIAPTLSVGAAAAFLAVTLRVPFWGAPLTGDEGGYAEAARLWARGWHLYTDVGVDRPQGLILGFRAIRWLGLTSPEELRVASAAIGLLVLGLTMLVAYRFAGRHAAMFAAVLLAVAGSSPYIESFTLSGELLALLPTLVALLALTVYTQRSDPVWLLIAGLLAGCALTVKQSALEGLLAGVAYLVWTERNRCARPVALVVASAALPLSVAAAAAPSFHEW